MTYSVSSNIVSFPYSVTLSDNGTSIIFDVDHEESFIDWWSKNEGSSPFDQLQLGKSNIINLGKYKLSVLQCNSGNLKIETILNKAGILLKKLR